MTAKLHRRTFTVGRDAEYFAAKELESQTGQGRAAFAAVVLKELVDNALDAAETAERTPEIALDVDDDGDDLRLTVADNGPGMATETLSRILDFSIRTSDKAAYRSPTRGLRRSSCRRTRRRPTGTTSRR